MLFIARDVFRLHFLLFLLLTVIAADVLAQDESVTECDRLAAHPQDPNKIATGIAWNELDASAALSACEAALDRDPANPRLQYQYGRSYDKQKYLRDAVRWYREAAQQGYASAQNSLGYAYERGEGVEASYQKAFTWYQKAARQGHAQAQNNLGTLYYKGQGVNADNEKALYWYRKAAEKGNAIAQLNVGSMYSQGLSVEKNNKTAFGWYLKAAKQNLAHAQYHVGMAYIAGNGIEANRRKAKLWFERAAGNGNYQAEEALNQMQFRAAYCDSLYLLTKNQHSQTLSDTGKLAPAVCR
ncbi:MAG: tetratricopeptide repeat protein [Gammaproteobacteria bacterium]|jgi:TPR repeat protein